MNEPEMFRTERLLRQHQSLYDKGFAEGYRQAIEDAAKVAEAQDIKGSRDFEGYGPGATASSIAYVIRALLEGK